MQYVAKMNENRGKIFWRYIYHVIYSGQLNFGILWLSRNSIAPEKYLLYSILNFGNYFRHGHKWSFQHHKACILSRNDSTQRISDVDRIASQLFIQLKCKNRVSKIFKVVTGPAFLTLTIRIIMAFNLYPQFLIMKKLFRSRISVVSLGHFTIFRKFGWGLEKNWIFSPYHMV